MNNEFELIFSLGSLPITASLLKALDLQFLDFPFDFTEGSDLKHRIDMLMTNFEGFMKFENMKLYEEYEGQEEDYYMDTATGLVFTNEYDIDLPLENTYPNALAKYKKIIKHLLLKIKKSKSILMIYVENPRHPEDEEENIGLIKSTLNTLREAHPKKSFNFLYVRNEDPDVEVSTKEICENAYIIKTNFYTSFSELSIPQVQAEVLASAFSQIKLKMTWRQRKIMWTQKMLEKLIEFREEHEI